MPRHAGNQQKHFEFALWASSLGRPPSIKEVEGFYQVTRHSAWRIHRNWMQAQRNHRIHWPAANGTTSHQGTNND